MNSRSRDDDDRYDRQGSRGGSGNYGRDNFRQDDRFGSERQGRGWFGDSRGHSEAARRGWEEREDRMSGGGRGGNGSRGRDDDDDRGSRGASSRGGNRGNQGHGGWFGDSAGHAEAARRGWEDRR